MVEGNFADSVKGRVEVFSTRYNNPYSSSGRGWITVDRKQIANFSTTKSRQFYQCIYHIATPTECVTHPAVIMEERTPGLLVEEGEFSRFDLHNCCFAYLNFTVEDAINHESPLINCLAVLDRRIGKRRLPLLKKAGHHPLVEKLLNFRLEAEGIHLSLATE